MAISKENQILQNLVNRRVLLGIGLFLMAAAFSVAAGWMDNRIVTADGAPPQITVEITSSAAAPVNGDFDVTVTFSENVIDFNAHRMLEVGHGTVASVSPELSHTSADAANTYTVTITPRDDSSGTVSVRALHRAALDPTETRHSERSETFKIAYDRIRPGGYFTSESDLNPQLLRGGPVEVRLMFVEPLFETEDGQHLGFFNDPVPDVTPEDFTITPAGAGVVDWVRLNYDDVEDRESYRGSFWRFRVTPARDFEGELRVSLLENAVQDLAGNGNILSSIGIHRVPVVTLDVTSSAEPPHRGRFTLTLQFSHTVRDFTPYDLRGRLRNYLVPGSFAPNGPSDRFTMDIDPPPDFNGSLSLIVPPHSAEPVDNDRPVSGAQFETSVDTAEPSPEVIILGENYDPDTGTGGVGPFDLQYVFMQTITDATGYSDVNEPVTGLEVGDFVVEGGVASDLRKSHTDDASDGAVYTITITPDPGYDGMVIVTLPENAAQDEAGNGNREAPPSEVYRPARPTVEAATEVSGPVNGPFEVTFTFSTPVHMKEDLELIVENGSVMPVPLRYSGDNMVTAWIAPDYAGPDYAGFEGPVSVTMPEGAARHHIAAGLLSAASPTLVIDADTRPPKTLLTASEDIYEEGPLLVWISFQTMDWTSHWKGEQVTGLTADDFVIGHGAVTSLELHSVGTWKMMVKPDPLYTGDITIDLPAGAVQDGAGNGNLTAEQASFYREPFPPGVQIGNSGAYSITGTGEFEVDVQFRRPVSGLEEKDFIVSGGSVAENSLTGSGSYYLLSIEPPAEYFGYVEVTLVAGAVTADDNGVPNKQKWVRLGRVDSRSLFDTTDQVTAYVDMLPYSNPSNEHLFSVVMSFANLTEDSDPNTIDYIFRADVKDSEDGDADGCENRERGHGLGVDHYIRKVSNDPEVRAGSVSADCPAGDYTVRASVSSADGVELSAAEAAFSVAAPAAPVEPPEPEAPSSDATLSGLTLSDVPLAFSSATTVYPASVANGTHETTVTPTTNDDGATYVVKLGILWDQDRVIPLAVGSNNVITVEVTAEDGYSRKTYTITVTRAEPPLPLTAAIGLSAYSVEEGTEVTLTMSFANLESDSDASTTDYVFRADVKDWGNGDADGCEDEAGGGYGLGLDRYMNRVDEDPEVRTGTISADCPAGNYTVRASISSADGVELAAAEAAFSVVEPGEQLAEPPSRDATLSGLTLSDVPLAFSSTITVYIASVASDTHETTVTPTTNDDGATYLVKLGGVDDADRVIPLAVGSNNVITVEVTAEDGVASRTYTVTVIRAEPPPSPTAAIDLSAYSVEEGTEVTLTMSFANLERDVDTTSTDYVFRADVKDSENGDADGCEDKAGGYGLGVDRYMWQVDEDPEVRTGTISGDCGPGEYAVEATLTSADGVELAAARAAFTVTERAQ